MLSLMKPLKRKQARRSDTVDMVNYRIGSEKMPRDVINMRIG